MGEFPTDDSGVHAGGGHLLVRGIVAAAGKPWGNRHHFQRRLRFEGLDVETLSNLNVVIILTVRLPLLPGAGGGQVK